MPRLAAFTLLFAYVAVAVAAYFSTLGPVFLSLRIGVCGDIPCASRVMPAGKAWDQGARPGMTVLSVDGRRLTAYRTRELPRAAVREAKLLRPTGDVLPVRLGDYPIGRSPMKFSLWVVGGVFALLGVAVLLRRPDLHMARMFALFACFGAVGLAVGPSSGGPAPQWALVVQFLSLVGIGASCLPFVLALAGKILGMLQRILMGVFVGLGLFIIGGYAATLLVAPSVYELVRPAVHLYASASLVGSVGILAVRGFRQASDSGGQQARIALFGIALGTLPFVGLTLIPEAVGVESLLPVHLSVLSVGLVPASFAYAILQHQLMGIRRLVHRGMVYGLATLVLIVMIASMLGAVVSLAGDPTWTDIPLPLVSTILAGGIILFFPLRMAARWLIDRLIYRDVVDYRTFISAVPSQMTASNSTPEIATAVADRLAQILRLESVLLYLGPKPAQVELVAAVGDRAEWVLGHIHPQLQQDISVSAKQEVLKLRWESDSLVAANLKVPEQYLGYVLLGPKVGGEIFVDEEIQTLASITPVLSLAIDKSLLSDEMRELNQRLVSAEEAERRRISSDLHDGPLQKALLITRIERDTMEDARNLAHQLVFELREISSRLRPAILDDLGLSPSLEWLLDGISKRSAISTRLFLHNVSDDERFSPEIEQAMFRVTQEAVNNVLKHSKATHVEVSLSQDNHNLVLRVIDDGVGLGAGMGVKGGAGIMGMRERVVQLGGVFEISSAPGVGTTVVMRVPLSVWRRDE